MTLALPEHRQQAVHGAGALAVRPDQTAWTPEQAAVLRQSGIKDEVTAAELSSFLHLCQRTGLDPFSRQIYLIGRWSKQAGREVYTPQTGIDGYRVIAQRATAQTGGTYGYEDTLWCDQSGRWRDVWLADAPPPAAKVTVIRNGQRFGAVATFREYVQTFPDGNPKNLWAKMPAGQIAKCAEALALRKAFPLDLAGVYTAEEMAQADNQPAAASARDFLTEAQDAPDADAVRALWVQARRAGAPDETLATIAEVGRRKTGAKPEESPGDEHQADEQPTTGDAPPTATDHDHAAALTAMYHAASTAGLDRRETDAAFAHRYGHGPDQATTTELAEVTADLTTVGGDQ